MKYEPVQIPDNAESTEQPAQEKKKPSGNKRQMIEDALGLFYEFRRNSLTKIPEFRAVNDGHSAPWIRMTDEHLNTIERHLQLSGFAASESVIWKIIRSDYCPAFHPIKDYFLGLPEWDKKDWIAQLARTVTVVGGENFLFEKYFKKWIVAAVANVLVENFCANQLVFVLASGDQGAYKSTWISHLYPTDLLDYCMEGGLDPENKDSLIRAAENFLINMDDYFADVSAKKVNSLKGFITQPVIKVRRPYARVDEVMQKICSFVGSTNEAQFLYDDTGDRRFICFEVEKIDIDAAKRIDINKVYAQALHLFRNKFVYWIEGTDKEEQQAINARFRVQSFEYEMCYRYFERPSSTNPGEFMTTSQIANYLSGFTKANLSLKRIGQSLKLQGYERKSARIGNNSTVAAYGYQVVKVDFSQQQSF